MKKSFFVFFIIIIFSFSCRKDSDDIGCGCAGAASNIVENQLATIIILGDDFFMKDESGVELDPCGSIPDSLKVEGLEVIWSGEFKVVCSNIKAPLPISIHEIMKR